MKTFIIADLNLFSEKQCKEMGFSSFAEMNSLVINNWNKTISSDDSVLIMGHCGEGTYDEMKSIISKLNGKLTMMSYSLNNRLSKEDWLEIGFTFCWDSLMFYKVPDGEEVLYVCKKVQEPELFAEEYDLLIVDSQTPLKTMTGERMLSADAAKWGYSPLNTDELFTIYVNMRTFDEMENEEYEVVDKGGTNGL